MLGEFFGFLWALVGLLVVVVVVSGLRVISTGLVVTMLELFSLNNHQLELTLINTGHHSLFR